MMEPDNYLIDTSVWLAYFEKETPPLSNKMDEVLRNNNIFVPKLVIAELMEMANSDQEVDVIEDFIDAFRVIDHEGDTWIRAGRLLYRLREKGIKTSLRNCFLALLAEQYGCQILSINGDFRSIQEFVDISVNEID